jgi:DNA-binding MarR family transcriptional regulator
MRPRPRLRLPEFVPFRINRLASEVSAHLSEIYRERFGLEIPDWRVLVTVAEDGACSARHVAHSTHMHKTRVSRAVARLQGLRLLRRSGSGGDGRESALELSDSGWRLYAELVPLALRRERELLACLTSAERSAFLVALDKLERVLKLTQP